MSRKKCDRRASRLFRVCRLLSFFVCGFSWSFVGITGKGWLLTMGIACRCETSDPCHLAPESEKAVATQEYGMRYECVTLKYFTVHKTGRVEWPSCPSAGR